MTDPFEYEEAIKKRKEVEARRAAARELTLGFADMLVQTRKRLEKEDDYLLRAVLDEIEQEEPNHRFQTASQLYPVAPSMSNTKQQLSNIIWSLQKDPRADLKSVVRFMLGDPKGSGK